MTNKARGIAQKPSEPRVHIIDNMGNVWDTSSTGTIGFEKLQRKQIAIGQRLELHQSLETKLVFEVPEHASGLQALIEEGPFITRFLFRVTKKYFQLSES